MRMYVCTECDRQTETRASTSVGAVRRTAHGHRGSGLNGKIIVFVVGLGLDHVLPP